MHVEGRKASLLLTYLSVSAAISSAVCGLLSQRLTNRILLLQSLFLIGGLGDLFFPFYTSYSHLVAFSILMGVSGSFLAVMIVIPQDIVGPKEVVNAIGILSFITSITESFAPAVVGKYTADQGT